MRGATYKVKQGPKVTVVVTSTSTGSTTEITTTSLRDIFNTVNKELLPLDDDLKALNNDMRALHAEITALFTQDKLSGHDQKNKNPKKGSKKNKNPSSFWENDVSVKPKSIHALKSLIAARREVETNKYAVEQLEDGVYALVKKTSNDISPAIPPAASTARKDSTGSTGPC